MTTVCYEQGFELPWCSLKEFPPPPTPVNFLKYSFLRSVFSSMRLGNLTAECGARTTDMLHRPKVKHWAESTSSVTLYSFHSGNLNIHNMLGCVHNLVIWMHVYLSFASTSAFHFPCWMVRLVAVVEWAVHQRDCAWPPQLFECKLHSGWSILFTGHWVTAVNSVLTR